MLALKLPLKIEARLDAIGRRTGRSTTSNAREAILEHLADAEIALQRLKDLKDGRSKTVPRADLMARYGLDG